MFHAENINQKKRTPLRILSKILLMVFPIILITIGIIYAAEIIHEYFYDIQKFKVSVSIIGAIIIIGVVSVLIYINQQKNMLYETYNQAQLMLETIPLSCSLWDRDYKIIDCNQESAVLFNLKDKTEFKKKFFHLSPEYQPCGKLSRDMAVENIEKAFEEGYCRSEWMHKTRNNELLPCEVILIRVRYKKDYIVAAYIRDMRELKSTLSAMHKVEEELRFALVVAEESVKSKSEFLDNMNHELRTPMNGILGFLRMALQQATDEEWHKHIEQAEISAKNLMKIINDVLDFTKIEDKKMQLHAVSFNLSDLFNEVIEPYANIIKEKALDLKLRLPPDLPDLIVGDSQKLKQVLTNLVDNALKFTEKGKIIIKAAVKRQLENHIEMDFYVKDTGIGMNPEQIKHLFDPFWQADTSATRPYGGTGMGLALAKHLVNLMGGRIWAESEYEEGSTFHFNARFTLSENSLIPMIPFDSKSEIIPQVQKKEIIESETTEKSYDPNAINLLLAEDVEINQIIAESILTGMGYNVDIANNGQEAIDMLKKKNYHAVLMDIQMPVLDGLTATKKIREIEKYQKLPIIAVSAHSMPADREKSLESGMNDHITKPIDPDILNETLNKWLIPGVA